MTKSTSAGLGQSCLQLQKFICVYYNSVFLTNRSFLNLKYFSKRFFELKNCSYFNLDRGWDPLHSLLVHMPEVYPCTEAGTENPPGFSLHVIFFHSGSVKNMRGESLIIRKQLLHLLLQRMKIKMLHR